MINIIDARPHAIRWPPPRELPPMPIQKPQPAPEAPKNTAPAAIENNVQISDKEKHALNKVLGALSRKIVQGFTIKYTAPDGTEYGRVIAVPNLNLTTAEARELFGRPPLSRYFILTSVNDKHSDVYVRMDLTLEAADVIRQLLNQ